MVEWRLNSLEETENIIVFHSKFYIFYLFRSSANESISYWTLFLFLKGLTFSLFAILMNEIELKHYILPCKNSKKFCYKRKNLDNSM